jgi:hypothetical protein
MYNMRYMCLKKCQLCNIFGSVEKKQLGFSNKYLAKNGHKRGNNRVSQEQ